MKRILGSLGLAGAVALFTAMSANAACTGSGTSWNCPAGATPGDVQNAINSAADGATITFAPGSYTWGTAAIDFDNNKGLTLDGGNKNAVVTIAAPGYHIGINDNGPISGNNTKLYRITGFTFQNAPANVIFWFYGTTGASISTIRFDHNTLSDFDSSCIAVMLGSAGPWSKINGVFDHNLLTGATNFLFVKVIGVGDPSQYSSSIRGTVANTFVEDNTFDFASSNGGSVGSGCVDIWGSAGMVFRHNTTRNCMVTSHGTLHAGGAINFELYSNTLQMDNGSITPDGYRLFHHQGSGEFTAYQNTFLHSVSPINPSALAITHYRTAECANGAMYSCTVPRCDGTNVSTSGFIDGNISMGYPCWMQPGRAPAGGSPAWGTLSPIYTWQNVDAATGNKVPLNPENYSATAPLISDHIKADRDFYDAVSNQAQTSPSSPFNGSTGMGFGTLANRPTTCATNPNEAGGGVGYWATDFNTLYRCSATNQWTVQYTPFTYPHPMTTGGVVTTVLAPAKPTGLIMR